MSAVPESGPSLAPAEVEAQLQALPAADWRRAQSIASAFCGGLTGWSSMDLLQETVTRFLEGRRTWPAGVHPLVVLKSAMHSIASNARKHNELNPVDDTVTLATFDTADAGTVAVTAVYGVVSTTPEDSTAGKQELAAVYAVVAGDEELEFLVMAWADGLRGDEAATELGWDKKTYEAARKRLTRRLDAIAPDRRKT
jgi:DNA-directed RNA polymerase specialized sigma24 family protein